MLELCSDLAKSDEIDIERDLSLSFIEPGELSRNGLEELAPSAVKKLVLLEEGTRALVEPIDSDPRPPPNNSTSLVASATALNLSKNLPVDGADVTGIPPLIEAEAKALF
ncbi:hypothetical protein WICMUC_005814 [Wickerhamomyces mucosus]|uniref:Uncharacterized protein n=1 Tax=Wickerhamomyces mucosus TaxID=1378264 RepID=A0A9P8T3Q4_9ASCO|nr:hypothetical protein WICMUC_005814 [Wickerhamomyces mucosus]